MVGARNGCTDNDPASAPGWMSWKDGSRRFREIGRSKGYAKDDADQIPWVVDVENGRRFAVSNTDDGTGVKGPGPQNRSRKGPATDRAVSENQGSFFDRFDDPEFLKKVIPLSMKRGQPGIIISWYLCVYCEGDEVRAELSCPVGADGGFFSDFMERLVLIGDGDDGPGEELRKSDDGDDGTEFDIPVSRK